jgi:site-specific recombinase XerD
LAGKRDRAILLLGFAGAFRRSELVALTVADLEVTADGLKVTIRKSKTDQEGLGQVIVIPSGARLKVVKALVDWLDAANINDGHLFCPINKGGAMQPTPLTCKSIAQIIKKYAGLAGLNEADFSGHSLRAGFLTSAAEAGAIVFKMAEVSRHKSIETLRLYVRSAEFFKDHAGASFL